MKNMIFISFALPLILESRGRLLQKTTERSIVSKNDDFKAVSITKHCLHEHEHHERKSRSSMEVSEAQNGTNIKRSIQKAIIPLVKKPIPTYVEIDYEEDYQTRMVRWPEKYTDSSENEDEDFSVDDYEFDVNHDEYATRGKPLVPRRKGKIGKNYANTKLAPDFEVKSTSEKIKVVSEKVVTPQNKSPKKREEIFVETTKNPSKVKEDDYYDEFTTKTSEKIVKIIYTQEDAGEEIDDSREYVHKSSVRTIRSPWSVGIYIDKLGEKTSLIMDKILSILPMFPQIPRQKSSTKK